MMNLKLLLPVLILFCIRTNTIGQTVQYTYDANGNRIARSLVVEQLQSGSVAFPIQNPEALMPAFKSLNTKGSDLTIYKDAKADIGEAVLTEEGEIGANIFPNPTKGILKIEITNMPLQSKREMRVYDLSGTQLLMIKDFDHFSELNIEHLRDGIYILRIFIDKTLLDFKIIKR